MLMSLLAGAAQNEYWLIAARAAMGIGAALMFPGDPRHDLRDPAEGEGGWPVA